MIKYTRIVSKLKHKVSGIFQFPYKISMKDEIERNTPLTQIRYLHLYLYIFPSPSFLLPHSRRYHLNRSTLSPFPANPTPRQLSPMLVYLHSSLVVQFSSSTSTIDVFSKRHRNYTSPSPLLPLYGSGLNFNPPSRGAGRD